jgi:hypothetical protein
MKNINYIISSTIPNFVESYQETYGGKKISHHNIKPLCLTVKKKWFDMIASGEKKEEYRELKKYWAIRLCEKLNVYRTCGDRVDGVKFGDYISFSNRINEIVYKYFDYVVFKNGYMKNAPTLIVECKKISIGTPKKKWCEDITFENNSENFSDKCFIIELGKIIKKINVK